VSDRDLFDRISTFAAPEPTPRPPTARARRQDPQTSHDAAAAFYVSKLKQYQYDVYRLFSIGGGPCHDEELIRRAKLHGLQQKSSGIRTRRHELVELTLLRDSGRTVTLSDSHRESIVWEVNPNPQPPESWLNSPSSGPSSHRPPDGGTDRSSS
jgi:hypothetical protein